MLIPKAIAYDVYVTFEKSEDALGVRLQDADYSIERYSEAPVTVR